MVRRNLPPEAEPWGRTVDSRLDSIEKRLAKIDQDTSNSFQMLSGQLTQIINQQKAIQDTVAALGSQQELLSVNSNTSTYKANRAAVGSAYDTFEFQPLSRKGSLLVICTAIGYGVGGGTSSYIIEGTYALRVNNVGGPLDILSVGPAEFSGDPLGAWASNSLSLVVPLSDWTDTSNIEVFSNTTVREVGPSVDFNVTVIPRYTSIEAS